MKKVMLLLAAVVISSALYAQTNMVRLTRFDGKKITGVNASSGFKVQVIASDKTSAVVEIRADLEPYLIFEISPEGVVRLGIDTQKNKKLRLQAKDLTATVHFVEMKELRASSGADIEGVGSFTGNTVVLNTSSGAEIDAINLTAGSVKMDASSGSKLEANIVANDINARVSSAAKIGGNYKTTKGLTVDLSSSASGNVIHNGQSGSFNLSSAATLNIKGQVETVGVESSSASSFKGSDYNAQSASAAASSAGSINFGVIAKLDAVASSAGSVRYKGTPVINRVSSSSAGSIKKAD